MKKAKGVATARIVIAFLVCFVLGCRQQKIENNTAGFDPRETGDRIWTCLPKKILAYMRTRAGNLDPAGIIISVDNTIAMTAFGQLTAMDQYDNIRPYLAKSWKVSQDGKEYIFILDNRFKFSNGMPIAAKDIAFSIERLFAKELNSMAGMYLFGSSIKGTDLFREGRAQNISGIQVVNDGTIRFLLNEPRANFLTMLSMGPASIIPAGSSYRSLKAREIVSSGPYLIEAFSPEKVVLKKNAYYPDAAKLSEITFQAENRKLCAVLQSEFYDFLDAGPIDRPLCDAPAYNMARYPNANIWFISFGKHVSSNLRRQIVSCVDVSRYLGQIETKDMLAKPLNGLFPSPASPRQDEIQANVRKVSCDLTQPRTLRLLANERHYGTEFLRDIFNGIGKLKVEVVKVGDAMHQQARATGDYDMLFVEFTGTFSDPNFYAALFYSKGSIVTSGYRNKQYDALTDKLASALSAGQQHEIMDQLNALAKRDPPAIFVKQHDNVEWIKKSLRFRREGWNINRYFFSSQNAENCSALTP